MSRSETIWVASTRDLRDALAAGYKASQLGIPDLNESCEAARAEGLSEGLKQGYQKGLREAVSTETGGLSPAALQAIQAQERNRILQIQALAEEGFDRLMQEAIEMGLSVEKFAINVLMEKKDRGITLEQIRKDAPVAAGHGGVPAEGWDGSNRPRRLPDAAGILGKRQAAMRGSGLSE